MAISIGTEAFYNVTSQYNNKTNQLQETLSSNLSQADDEALMDVCKSFESYLMEQVFKKMDSTILREEEDSEYVDYFKDMMFQEYANDATSQQGLGIAQMLFESMKRNQ